MIMDPLAYAIVRRTDEEALTRHLEQRRMAQEIVAERRRLAGATTDTSRTAPHRRRRLAGLLHPSQRRFRLA